MSQTMTIRDLRNRGRIWMNKHGGGRFRNCGWAPVNSNSSWLVRNVDGTHSLGGVQHCGSVWACPTCSARIMGVRADLLGRVITAWRDKGGHIAMMTLTLRHNASQSLADLWSATSRCWQAATSSGTWSRLGRARGIEFAGRAGRVARRFPLIRTVEVTVSGRHGWHPHVHALVFLPPSSFEEADALLTELFQGVVERWVSAAQREGFSSLARVQEAHILTGRADVEAGAYLAKSVLGGVGSDLDPAVGLELVGAQHKAARVSGSMTAWDLLASLAMGSSSEWILARWREFVRASHGRRQMSVTPGWLKHLGFDAATLTDEAKAMDQISDLDEGLLQVQECTLSDTRVLHGPSEFLGVIGSVALRGLIRTDVWPRFLAGHVSALELDHPDVLPRVITLPKGSTVTSAMTAVGIDRHAVSLTSRGWQIPPPPPMRI